MAVAQSCGFETDATDTVQVARGIRVAASPMFVPEHSQLGSEDGKIPPKYFFAYR